MRLYKIISNLLDYPDREIIENLDELIQIIDNPSKSIVQKKNPC